MLDLDDQQQAARDWFESLRDRICAAFEEIEREIGSNAAFSFIPWDRSDGSGASGDFRQPARFSGCHRKQQRSRPWRCGWIKSEINTATAFFRSMMPSQCAGAL